VTTRRARCRTPHVPECFEHGAERSTVRREPIPHAKCWFVPHRACHEAVRFELPQVLAQHLNGDAGHGSVKLAESTRAFAESAADHWLPPTVNDADRGVDGTTIAFDMAFTASAHVCPPAGQGTSKCLIVAPRGQT